MRVILVRVFVIISLFLLSAGLYAESYPALEILTEEFAPYNFEENGKLQGISVDLLVLMLERAGFSETREDIKVMVWSRAYGLVLNNPDTLLFSMTRTKERENLFKWVGPIDTNVIELFAKKSKHIVIPSADDFVRYRIGTVINDAGEQLLVAHGYPLEKLYRVVQRDQIRHMLYNDRIDLTPDNRRGFIGYTREAGYNPDDFESVYVLNTDYISYAFNEA